MEFSTFSMLCVEISRRGRAAAAHKSDNQIGHLISSFDVVCLEAAANEASEQRGILDKMVDPRSLVNDHRWDATHTPVDHLTDFANEEH